MPELFNVSDFGSVKVERRSCIKSDLAIRPVSAQDRTSPETTGPCPGHPAFRTPLNTYARKHARYGLIAPSNASWRVPACSSLEPTNIASKS